MQKSSVYRAILLLTTAVGASAALSQAPETVVPDGKLIPVSTDVYIYQGVTTVRQTGETSYSNSLVVVTDEGVLIADGQRYREEGEHLLRELGKITSQPVKYLVNASPHLDHSGANAAFVDSVIISHEDARPAIAAMAGRAAPGLPLPVLTYRDRMQIHLGGKLIELYFFGKGHTAGDTVVYLPEQKVAFLSELFFNDVFASVGEGYTREHLETLDQAMLLDAEWFLPAHGLVEGQSTAQLRIALQHYYDNIQLILEVVTRHIAAGHTLEQTLADIDKELAAYADTALYRFLRDRSVSGTYDALMKKP